ncbi:MAG TPA: hypothetical protein O0X97_05840 [Methanocorpusculum sp.]|nr:hypothetical protein [Methanocorpusculum sp.]
MTEPQTIRTNAEDILSCLIAEHSLTAVNPFERAYSLQTVKETLELIIKELELAYVNTVGFLLDTGQRSSSDKLYRLEEVTEFITAVDKQKLLRNEPEFYEKVARVSASTFVKELGHNVLRNLLIDKCGLEKVHLYDTVNIKDFDAAYPDKSTAGEYRKAGSHTAEYRIVKEDSTAAENEPGTETNSESEPEAVS